MKEAYEKAIEVLEKCATPHGFYASGGKDGYNAVWSRDSMISSLGASLLNDKFKKTFRESLMTLKENQSEHGQIPNCVDKWSGRKPHVDFQSIDSTLWFLIGLKAYEKKYGKLKFEKEVKRAFDWLACQDVSEIGMLAQLPTTDWQDAFPHKYGHCINTQALYYHALNLYGKKKEAERLKRAVNEDEDKKLWNGNFYYSWRWKNHGNFREVGEWFDSLGNLLAIVFGLADEKKAKKILNYIDEKKINLPFPMKAIFPTIEHGSKEWQDYYEDCDARLPHSYLNGGVWTFIGGFYVLALIKMKMFDEAEKQIEKLAEANSLGDWNFSEWIHGKNEKASEGGIQAWNAGSYILAYESLKERRVLVL